MKEDGFKDVRGGEDGFSRHGRGSEDMRKDKGVSKTYASPVLTTDGTGASIPIGGRGRQPNAHGFGHKGNQVKGVLRLSGCKGAHRVGRGCGSK
jgi:hypothetical protein